MNVLRIRIRFAFLLFAILFGVFSVRASSLSSLLRWSDEGLVIVLEDNLHLPNLNWPVTMLEYSIDFSADPIHPEELLLTDRNGTKSVPFQLIRKKEFQGQITHATLCFLSDLPSGGRKEFHLLRKNSENKKVNYKNPIAEIVGENIRMENGLIQVDLPLPGIYDRIMSPIFRIGDNNRSFAKVEIPSHLSWEFLEVTEVENGPLLAEYRLNFALGSSHSYSLTLRLLKGLEYLEITEKIVGFTIEDSLYMNVLWDNFTPAYRYCPNRPGSPIDKTKNGYDNFAWEKIEGSAGDPEVSSHPGSPYDQMNLTDGKLPFKITPYHNWMTWWRLHVAAFWDERNDQTVGVFIKDFEEWVDPSYPIWGSKDKMSVHFYWKNSQLEWRFPIVAGGRSTALTIYPHQKDVIAVNEHKKPLIHVDYLRRWYGWISLNKTKNWILDYGTDKSKHPEFFSPNEKAKPSDLIHKLANAVNAVATGSERGNSGPTPVGMRSFFSLTELFEQTEKNMTLEEYRRARALYLFMAYICMDETLMPMVTMLSGHPNFLADIKAVPAMAVFLFPDHPSAQEIADHFEKSVALNLRYHTRPDVSSWEAKGGRWTENMACYTWAFLRPTLKPSALLHYAFDGKNRLLQPNISMYADWLLNGLTTPLVTENGKRGLPPQGAHARYSVHPNLLYILGEELRYYNPLLSEHISWMVSPDYPYFESDGNWENGIIAKHDYRGGTNPHLKSSKYTGYGITLRSDFGKSTEMYVHLQQIDAGPNYRWGRAAKGGNGVIYYNAAGKRYSHNGIEDVGDAPFGDTERCTNFGVKKEKPYRGIGDYRSVGMNELTEPLYDFGFAQFASVLANEEAAPEYRSRSILMSGSDYIMILDDVKDNTVEGRLSWFVGKDEDFPYIHQLQPGVPAVNPDIQPSQTPYHKDPDILPTKGRYYDGFGDFLTLVTHKESICATKINRAFRVDKEDGSSDWVFRSDGDISFADGRISFDGSAGIICCSKDERTYHAAMFKGNRIGIPGLTLSWNNSPVHGALSLIKEMNCFSGQIQIYDNTIINFKLREKLPDGSLFYLNGKEKKLQQIGKDTYMLSVSPGKYEWQWTNKGLIPGKPKILSTRVGNSKCTVKWLSVEGAESYLLQASIDGGNTWKVFAENIEDTEYCLSGLLNRQKYHIRITARAAGGLGEDSHDYPIYPEAEKPHAPEGLRIIFNDNTAELSWGRILGCDTYQLYRRRKNETAYDLIYSGTENSLRLPISFGTIDEYAVTAVNHNGESDKSIVADTDPKRLINWYPIPGEVFRRDTESHENGYIEYNHWIEEKMPVLHYPD